LRDVARGQLLFRKSRKPLTKKPPEEFPGISNWVEGLDLNQRPSGYEPDDIAKLGAGLVRGSVAVEPAMWNIQPTRADFNKAATSDSSNNTTRELILWRASFPPSAQRKIVRGHTPNRAAMARALLYFRISRASGIEVGEEFFFAIMP
jgi:hypothetical protein